MKTNTGGSSGYRPDIDGLRAFSVLAVIANHVDHTLLPRGYLGVDIFFVISGFVITASLWSRCDTALMPFLASFFYRRVRRLAPALLLAIVATSFAVWRFVPVADEQYATALAGLFGVSNIQLYLRNQDYFTPVRDLLALVHTWSLGVEEQFYLFFPFLLWFAGGGANRTGRCRLLVGVLATLSLVSFVGFHALTAIDRDAAFYLMPARFWELGAGALLFLVTEARARTPSMLQLPGLAPVAFAGLLVLVLLPAGTLSHAKSVSAAVALAVVLIATLRDSTRLHSVFAHPVSVYIGLISYPLYLWHWPVISIGHWILPPGSGALPLQLALIALLAVVTYEGVERPLRNAQLPWAVSWRLAIWGLVFVAAGGWIKVLQNNQRLFGASSAYARESPWFFPLKGSGRPFNPSCVVDASRRPLRPDSVDVCTVNPTTPDKPTIWALGDSHAGHLQGLLVTVHERTGVGVHVIETPGVAFPMLPGRELEQRAQIYRQISDRMRPGDIVLLGRLFLNRDATTTVRPDLSGWQDQLVAFAAGLVDKGIHVVVAGPPPLFQFRAAKACRTIQTYMGKCDIPREPIANSVRTVLQSLRESTRRAPNLLVFDTFAPLCPPGVETCSPLRDGKLMFRDGDHLNVIGSASLAPHFVGFLEERGLLPQPH